MQTEDEQAFLGRQQEIIKQGGQVRGDSPSRLQAGSKPMPRTPGIGSQNSPKKVRYTYLHIYSDMTAAQKKRMQFFIINALKFEKLVIGRFIQM